MHPLVAEVGKQCNYGDTSKCEQPLTTLSELCGIFLCTEHESNWVILDGNSKIIYKISVIGWLTKS